MKFAKYALLFLIPFLFVTVAIVAYFRLSGSVSDLKVPPLPSISLNDIMKFYRYSLEKAPSETLTGEITRMEGEVNYEKRLATDSARIERPVTIQQGDILDTGADGGLTINFKDAAELIVQPSTKVNIIQTLPANLVFMQSRGVVEYKKLGTYPVSVRALHLLIENKGNIKVSYDSDRPVITVVAVSGGAIIAFNDLNVDTQVINLNEGQTLIFNDATRRTSIQ